MSEKYKDSRLNELEIEKSEFEIEKIKQDTEKTSLEIKELKKSYFKKTNWWQIIIPLSFSIIPTLYLLSMGIFDSKYQGYKIEKASLELDQKKFAIIRDSIDIKIKKVQDSLITINNFLFEKQDSLSIVKELVLAKQDSLKNLSVNISLYKKNILELENTKHLLNTDIKNKDKTLANVILQKQSIENQMADTVKNLSKSLNADINKIGSATLDIVYLKKQISELKTYLKQSEENNKEKEVYIKKIQKDFQKLLEETKKSN